MNQVEIRLPDLSGETEAEQLRKIRGYLYSLAEQLQYAFDGQQTVKAPQVTKEAEGKTQAETLSSLKSLIIRSAEVTEQIAQQLETKLSGKYVAQSQFGTFTQLTEQKITASAQELRREFSNVQQLETDLEGLRQVLAEVSASIRTGLLYEDESGPVYGVEIGQQVFEDGVLRLRKFARLTADRLSFYDRNDAEVAYISDRRLYVTRAQVQRLEAEEASATRLRMGDYTWEAGNDGHLTVK